MNSVHIGHYRLGKTLGYGSYSKVKLAQHKPTGENVAVKVLNKQTIRAENLEKQVQHEIDILKMCTHPHIIRLYDVIETSTKIYVVTEYLCNGTLLDYVIKHHRLSDVEGRKFFQQIIAGVEYCHRNRIAHRDLKPDNMLLDENYNVKIADFGFSKLMRDGSLMKTSCGSANYAAPEIVLGNMYAGPEVDIWSCGVILYVLLCGMLPFDEVNTTQLYQKIKSARYELPSFLSGGCRDLISKLLVRSPMKRLSAENIRRHPWFAEDMPRYLLAPLRPEAYGEDVNDDIVEDVIRLTTFTREEVRHALEAGRRDSVTVVYHLLNTAKNESGMTLFHNMEGMSLQEGKDDEECLSPYAGVIDRRNIPRFLEADRVADDDVCYMSRPSVDLVETVATDNADNQMSSSGGQGMGTAFGNRYPGNSSDGAVRDSLLIPERKWSVGIRCSQDSCTDAMESVYTALRALAWKWKNPGKENFQVLVLVTGAGLDDPLKLRLQLFKSPSGYRLDVQRMNGDAIGFLLACSDLIREVS